MAHTAVEHMRGSGVFLWMGKKQRSHDVCEIITVLAIVLVALALLWAELAPATCPNELRPMWPGVPSTTLGPTMTIARAGPGP